MRRVMGIQIKSIRRQRGLTLVELMIGILLSLLILTAVVYVFAGSRASYRNQESLSAVQESGRIALEVLNRDIRMAGNPGCGNVNFLDHRSPLLFNNDIALVPAPGATPADPDGITVRRGSAEFATVASSPAINQVELTSTVPLGVISGGDILLLSDCAFTEALTVQAVAGNLVTATGNLSRQFRPGTQVMRLETVVYTVAGGQLLRNNQAVAAGITDLQFLYGISGGAGRSANRYEAAPDAVASAQAVAVKLALTIADGIEVSQSFNSTIALRNRAP